MPYGLSSFTDENDVGSDVDIFADDDSVARERPPKAVKAKKMRRRLTHDEIVRRRRKRELWQLERGRLLFDYLMYDWRSTPVSADWL